MSKALTSTEVWKHAGAEAFPKYIQSRNFKGLDRLRIVYGNSRQMAEKARPDRTVRLRSEPATLTTFWANSKTAPKKDEGQKRQPQALITEESSGEDSANEAERKRQDKKGAKGEAVHPLPFLSLGRTVLEQGRNMEQRTTFPFQMSSATGGARRASSRQRPPCPCPRKLQHRRGRSQTKGRSPLNHAPPITKQPGARRLAEKGTKKNGGPRPDGGRQGRAREGEGKSGRRKRKVERKPAGGGSFTFKRANGKDGDGALNRERGAEPAGGTT
jgi:hypothetical protein